MPLISCNIAVYNQLDYLKYIINALNRQNFEDFEVIVTDEIGNTYRAAIPDELRNKMLA